MKLLSKGTFKIPCGKARMTNRADLKKWRSPLIQKGYSFRYNKDSLLDRNKSITCIETGESFFFKLREI